MAMNKAERAELDRLKTALALHWPAYLVPVPMTYDQILAAKTVDGPKRYGYGSPEKIAVGWFYNAHTRRVTQGCSSGNSHNFDGLGTTSQGMGRMFKTKAEAAMAMRIEVTAKFADELAAIDAM